MKVFRAIALLIVAVILAGCGGQKPATTPEPTTVAMPSATTVAPPATSVAAVNPVSSTAMPTVALTATPTTVPAGSFGVPNALDEVRRLWPNVELPVKETMFLGGYIIGPLEPFLACLRIFGYFFAVIYCLVAVQWQINHRGTSWEEFLDSFVLGPAGKTIFIVSLAAAPVVYLTALHDFAVLCWWTDNSYIREALGWKLVGFSPDIDPESMLELLKWLPEWAVLHIVQEVFLLIGFVIAVVLAGLKRDLAPLRIWGVFYLTFVLYGMAVFVATTFVDSVRGAELVGNNLVWSSFVRINKMFVNSTKGLWYLLAYILPFFYAVHEMFFASKKTETGSRRTPSSEDVLNWVQTIALFLGLMNRPPANAPAGNGWPMWPPTYGQLGRGVPRLPSGGESDMPPTDSSGGGGKPGPGGRTGSGNNAKPSSRSTQSGGRVAAGKQEGVPPTGLWRILPPAETGGARVPGSGNRVQTIPLVGPTGKSSVQSPPAGSRKALASNGAVAAAQIVEEPPSNRKVVVSEDEATLPSLQVTGDGEVLPLGSGAANNDHQTSGNVSTAPRPVVDEDVSLPEPSAAAAVLTVPADGAVLGGQPTASQPVFQTARMRSKFGDLEEGEPVLVTVDDDGTATTVDGMKIPLEQLALEPDEEGGEG